MGTIVRDATAPGLATAQDIDTTAVGDGGIFDVKYPQDVGLEVELTTGTSGTGIAHITLYASNSSDMSDPVACGTVGPITGTHAAGSKFLARAYVPARYVRAQFDATGTLAGAADVNLVQPHTERVNAHPTAAADTGTTSGSD